MSDAPSIGPQHIVKAVVRRAMDTYKVPMDQVKVVHIQATTFSSSALGLPTNGGIYATVETPGYIVTVEVGPARRPAKFHTNHAGFLVAENKARQIVWPFPPGSRQIR